MARVGFSGNRIGKNCVSGGPHVLLFYWRFLLLEDSFATSSPSHQDEIFQKRPSSLDRSTFWHLYQE